MKKLLLVTMLMLSACASRELPLKGELMSASAPLNMKVSSQVINDYSDEYNLLLQINFDSDDGRWTRVDTADLDLENNDNAPYNVIIGKDLLTWAEAKAEEKRLTEYNSSMKTAGVMAAGGALAVVGALSKSEELAAAGMLVYTGAGIYQVGKEFNAVRKKIQGVTFVPDNHLMSPFTIPSKTLVKRWVLINAPTGRIAKTIRLNLKTVEGERYTYNIPLMN